MRIATTLSRLLGACLLALGAAGAQAAYPDKPVRVLVPVPAGQATDIAARIVADGLAKKWNVPVFVENRPGGAAIPGMVAGRDAAPDGYTLILGTSAALVVNPTLFKKLSYSPTEDFVLVTPLFRNPLLIVANADTPYKTLDDLVQAARKAPGEINWGVPGMGNTQHLTGELFKTTAGIDLFNIIFQGSAQMVTNLLGKQVTVGIDSIASSLPNIQAGKIRPLALTGASRAPQLPDVPTVAELGYPGFEGEGFGGIIVPRNTPEAIVEKIAADVRAVLTDDAVERKFQEVGMITYDADRQAWAEHVRKEAAKWAEVARRAGIQPQ
ncbi:tripartite tricarboxylate transporter substrate binding protein [Orrella sp. JC864]|uniref:Bug family tripartite tricarboxylate transporter substrate binding protein n=1 Tax=Orrella sp. JC864 TaxID=3120298 RepID=UPI0012BCC6C3